MAAKQFPNVPEDVGGLSDDELNRLLEQAQAAVDDLGDEADPERYDEIKKGLDDRDRVLAEVETRNEAKAEQKAKMDELISRAKGAQDEEPEGVEEPEPEPEPEADEEADEEDEEDEEPTAEEERDKDKQPITASAGKTRGGGITERKRILVAKPDGAGKRSMIEPGLEGSPAAITASADVPGVALGADLSEPLSLAKAMAARFHNLGTAAVSGDKVPVAQVKWGYPEERTLQPGAERPVLQKIRQAVGRAPQGREPRDAITASGGLCAPVEIRYDLPVLAQADRPVRDSLPGFNAVRGGIRFAAPPSLASITTAVGRITAAQDAAGGGPGTKNCQVIACPAFSEVDVAAIYHCLQFGNMGSRAYPELVDAATELTMAAWARLAETALLDSISTASTHTVVNLTPSGTAPLGANAILLPALLRASAAMRSRQRMDPEAILDVQMPAWTLDLLTSDLVRSAFDRFAANDADIIRTMESYGLRVNFYWDGRTAGNSVFGAQAGAGATLLEFPNKVDIFMYPAGSFLFLDGGTLDLGLVRDSTLNRTNDYQIFGESWENLAFVGLESLWLEVFVCDTGAVAAAVQSVCGS